MVQPHTIVTKTSYFLVISTQFSRTNMNKLTQHQQLQILNLVLIRQMQERNSTPCPSFNIRKQLLNQLLQNYSIISWFIFLYCQYMVCLKPHTGSWYYFEAVNKQQTVVDWLLAELHRIGSEMVLCGLNNHQATYSWKPIKHPLGLLFSNMLTLLRVKKKRLGGNSKSYHYQTRDKIRWIGAFLKANGSFIC